MNAHFFDIDIIVKTNAKPWIISKAKPNFPLLKIDNYQYRLIQSGIYKSMGHNIQFSGIDYWIPKELMYQIKVACKKKSIDISTLAISLQEFLNPYIIDHLNFELNDDLLKPLINSGDDVYFFCSKNKEKNYINIVSSLEEKLLKIGIGIKDFIYVTDTYRDRDANKIARGKIKKILQYLIGTKIEKNHFCEEDMTEYNTINLYDDCSLVYTIANDINDIFGNMFNTSDDFMKNRIRQKMKTNKVLVVNKWTGNLINKVEKKIIPIDYRIIKEGLKYLLPYKQHLR